jgi:hypothetical protein
VHHLAPLPPEVHARLRPCPADFSVAVVDEGTRILWRGRVTVEEPGKSEQIEVEVGYPKSRGKTHRDVDELVWSLQELARVGYRPGLSPARRDRHAGVKPAPQDVKAWQAAQAKIAEALLAEASKLD